jgi:hypothetical protein
MRTLLVLPCLLVLDRLILGNGLLLLTVAYCYLLLLLCCLLLPQGSTLQCFLFPGDALAWTIETCGIMTLVCNELGNTKLGL